MQKDFRDVRELAKKYLREECPRQKEQPEQRFQGDSMPGVFDEYYGGQYA